MLAQRQGLTKEVTELTQEEKKLDELIQSCTLDLKLLTEDSENQRYPFSYLLHRALHRILYQKNPNPTSYTQKVR